MLRVSVQISTAVHIDPDIIDQAALVVSQDNSCRFCFGMQRAFLRVLGVSEKRIERIEQEHLTGEFTPRERAALDFARRLSHSKPLASLADLTALRENGYSDDEIVEFAALVGLHMLLNRMSTFVALPPQPIEQMPDKWWVRILRPLLAIRFRQMRRRGKAIRLLEAEKSGPLSDFVNAMDGLPLARDLRIVLDRLWNSASLPARTVTILFAVIARALGSQRCENEATRLLRAQGFTAKEIEQILTHLTSPALSEIERLLVPLARETVWYQPAVIQRRCAETQAQVSAEQFLDFCGAASLLNMLCRVGVIVDIRA
jgi:AhpD family alkylhydroperoxidase